MTGFGRRQPSVNEAPHTLPEDASILAAPRQRAMPAPAHLEPKEMQRRLVHGDTAIPNVPTDQRLQPLALFEDGIMHAPLQLGFHLIELRLQSFADRLPKHGEHESVVERQNHRLRQHAQKRSPSRKRITQLTGLGTVRTTAKNSSLSSPSFIFDSGMVPVLAGRSSGAC